MGVVVVIVEQPPIADENLSDMTGRNPLHRQDNVKVLFI